MTDSTLAAPLSALFAGGTVRAVAGNAPLLLDGPGQVWRVQEGALELFLVRTGADGYGVRHPFMSAQVGDLLFGMDTSGGMGLLATGARGTTVVEWSLTELQGAAVSVAQDTSELVEAIDRWVGGLAAGVTRHITPRPRAEVVLAPDTSAVATPGQRLKPARGVLWVGQRDGTSLYIGMEDTPGASAVTQGMPIPSRVPLSADSWLQTFVDDEFSAIGTAAALAEGSLWNGLHALHALTLACEELNTALVAVDEYNRLANKSAQRAQRQQDALQQLAGIFAPAASRNPVERQSDDPLFLACAAVGREVGLSLRAPVSRGDEGARQTVSPLSEILRASQARMRHVMLDREWWCTDQGALLAWRAESEAPVALLPTSHRSYALYDPASGTHTPVTAAIAATLQPRAVMLYASFGHQVATGARILSLGLRSSGRDLWRIATLAALSSVLALVVPLATGTIFDVLVPQAQRGALMQLGLGLMVVAVAGALFGITKSIAVLRIESRFDATINAALMDRILRLPATFFREFSSGDLGLRAMTFSTIRQLLSVATVDTIFGSLTVLPSVLLLLYYDARLAVVALVVLLVTLGITISVGYLQLQRSRTLQRLEGRLSGLVLELLTGVSKLRVAGAEGDAFGVWARLFGEKRRVAYRSRVVSSILSAYLGALPLLASAVVFAGVMFTKRDGGFSTGDFVAFTAAFTQVLGASIALGTTAMSLLEVQPLYQRVRPILEAIPEVTADVQDPGELEGDITISRVTFRYDASGPPVLDDVSFHARRGEFVAIVGPSGSGKSTLLRLLLGFESPERGTVQYDGQNLKALDVSAVRRQLGVVLQHGKIMPGDIFRNIVGSTLLTIDDAWEAARRVALDDDIRRMPMGMHTVISEGGGTFSGGQRQRLLIARAVAQGPRILFFDEATSALDNATQAVVSASLDGLQATRVVIAHRLSTIINADRIYVMAAGRIVQSGSYDELMGQEGMFRELVSRQLA
jgi:NHLM bacteriocin system ABC transporter ATP-binding protein